MSQPDEWLDRVPEPPLWPEPSDRCSDCEGTGLLSDPVEPCVYCDGSGRVEPRPMDRERLKALEAALVAIWGRRVLPETSGRQIDLFARLNGGRA